MATMSICPKCARFSVHRICPFCNIRQIPTEMTLEEAMKITDKQEEEIINSYIETLIKDTYDPKAREYREANERPVFAGYVSDSNSNVICPYCKSSNTRKITNTSKALHTAVFGIFSMSRNSKQWHCNSCNSDF